jgi:hypothetical protein
VKPAAPWTLDDALKTLRELNPKLQAHGYCVALTGGVLFKGESAKDLDIVLYPLGSNETSYMPALNAVIAHFNSLTCYAVEHAAQGGGKSIFVLKTRDGMRIDVFLPHVAFKNRVDPFIVVDKSYADAMDEEITQ